MPFWECQFESGRGTTFKMNKLTIISDKNLSSLKLKKQLSNMLNKDKVKRSNVIIVIGGDGFCLKHLKKIKIQKIILWN